MISILPPGQNKIIRTLFREYYERAELELPFDMELREFGFQPLNGGSYVRHMSFASPLELKMFLVRETPGHVFYSSAKYQRPSAKDMEEKGWMGSDLQFDIDADDLCEVRRIVFCPVCGREVADKCPEHGVESKEYVEIGEECMRKAWEDARDLRDILEEDFDLRPRVYFSGNRGFHVLVECTGDCALMDSEDRREVVKYVKGESSPEAGQQGDPGWPGRKARGVKGVEVDQQVTVDVHRLVRIPGSIHAKSSLVVREMEEFRYDLSLSPFTGVAVFKPYLSGEFNLLDKKFVLERGVPTEMHAGYALFGYMKGLGEVTYYVR
ncbi:DNA primase small subunit PriS [Metallosphaera tengchongensis]|uniref:DNA primase small subunit PriS n=1 Tax=Metallosphaera tengchongensis TaxID=1532350 RepID=A0A6N0NWE0_9CREN|nr:DNA primase small subunit PriS [Metallosphaera tengchongensis]QKQ99430.1 DNA primase small subunit PriS [Metallosphaera tengchongensis]